MMHIISIIGFYTDAFGQQDFRSWSQVSA